MYMPFWLY